MYYYKLLLLHKIHLENICKINDVHTLYVIVINHLSSNI